MQYFILSTMIFSFYLSGWNVILEVLHFLSNLQVLFKNGYGYKILLMKIYSAP